MKLKAILAKPFANFIYKQIKKSSTTAVADQQQIFSQLIKTAGKTLFGTDHHFDKIKTHADYCQQVPIRDYEALKPYIEKIKEGRHNVLWKGRPIYFAKTSGTTSGVKYIPITKDSISNHIDTARNALLCYMEETGNTKLADGKLIFLSGSPTLERLGDIPTGRLSGIVNHHVPKYLRSNQLPTYETNCIDDWEEKLDKIVEETLAEDMALIGGIPPWVQMYFDKLEAKSGKKIGVLFPNFSVMVQGGVNYEPYKARLQESIGRPVDTIELFPASEGFFAFQDTQKEKAMLLNTNSGIFFEFVPVPELSKPNPIRYLLADVQIGQNYALVISSNAGLWAYNIGDTVKFVSTNPFRIVVTGRTKQYISAFGEHVIVEEVEAAMLQAATLCKASISEYTVAPYISTNQGKSYHEWMVEFEQVPIDISEFAQILDTQLRQKNSYYDDLVKGNILQQLKITAIPKAGFLKYMKSIGKLGGQNKIPKVSNDRQIADGLVEINFL